MELTGTYSFPAMPSQVWSLLMDSNAIAACLPGCRELRPLGDDRYQADLTIGVAAVSGSFAVTIALLDKVPPHSYRLNVDATGKPGFARGSAAIVLSPEDGGTAVAVTAEAEVGGLIARVGQRLIEGVARMTMDRFYGCLAKRIGGTGILAS
jgi:carbon monoxide dehydrogenase subunit G